MYQRSDIYNADESVLFWMILQENSLGFFGQAHRGKKQSNLCITFSVEANMDGMDERTLLVIAKSLTARVLDDYIQCYSVADTTYQLIDEYVVDQIQHPAAGPDDRDDDKNGKVEEADQRAFKTLPH